MATLTAEQKQTAEEAADAIITETFGGLDSVEFPLDLDAILDKCAITLKKGNFEDKNISGAFSRSDSTIFVSGSESPERQLFTVAHELGHYKLHEDRTTDILYRKQVWQFNNGLAEDETQANWFAANLLMPTDAVKKMWKITRDVDQIAKFFGVSRSAMHFRLKDLGLVTA